MKGLAGRFSILGNWSSGPNGSQVCICAIKRLSDFSRFGSMMSRPSSLHGRFVARQFELAREAHGLAATVAEQADVAFFTHERDLA